MATKVKVLGIAQDGGLPQLGCYREHCQRARKDSRWARKVASLGLLNTGTGRVFLIDATPDIREQIELIHSDADLPSREARNPLDGVLLTHAHIGHYTGLIHFGKEVMNTAALPAYCTVEMARFLRNNGPWGQLVDSGNIELKVVPLEAEVALDDKLHFRTLPVPHRNEYTDTVGYEVIGGQRRLLYIPDIDQWHRWDKDIKALVREVDYALLDATFYSNDELPDHDMADIPHPLVEESLTLFGELAPSERSKIHFIHLNHTNHIFDADGLSRKRVEAEGLHIAEEGQIFCL